MKWHEHTWQCTVGDGERQQVVGPPAQPMNAMQAAALVIDMLLRAEAGVNSIHLETVPPED